MCKLLLAMLELPGCFGHPGRSCWGTFPFQRWGGGMGRSWNGAHRTVLMCPSGVDQCFVSMVATLLSVLLQSLLYHVTWFPCMVWLHKVADWPGSLPGSTNTARMLTCLPVPPAQPALRTLSQLCNCCNLLCVPCRCLRGYHRVMSPNPTPCSPLLLLPHSFHRPSTAQSLGTALPLMSYARPRPPLLLSQHWPCWS
jgi:hypothetical protein